ncbi:hypothetical protein JCM8547_004780 [Rhodosporidiobolus lusitaniae]
MPRRSSATLPLVLISPPSSLGHTTLRDRAGQQTFTLSSLLKAQYADPESWAANKIVLTAFGTFAAAVVAISQFGDLLVPTF